MTLQKKDPIFGKDFLEKSNYNSSNGILVFIKFGEAIGKARGWGEHPLRYDLVIEAGIEALLKPERK